MGFKSILDVYNFKIVEAVMSGDDEELLDLVWKIFATEQQERVIEEMKRRGLDTQGVTVVRPGEGSYYWVVKSGQIIGTYDHRAKKLTMTADVLAEYDKNA